VPPEGLSCDQLFRVYFGFVSGVFRVCLRFILAFIWLCVFFKHDLKKFFTFKAYLGFHVRFN
jgi:hypothetical protein